MNDSRASRLSPQTLLLRARLTAPPLAAATDAAEAAPASIAAMLAGSAVQPGEVVQLVLKPSRWFVLLQSLWFIAAAAIVIGLVNLTTFRPLGSTAANIQLLAFLIIGRLMYAVLQWMGRYYLITDQRIVRLSGVLNVNVQAFMLRNVVSVKCYPGLLERLLGKGSLYIVSEGEPLMIWQTLSNPRGVCEQVWAAVARSKHNGCHVGNGAA